MERFGGWNPLLFGWLGYYLWFLGFLFTFSLVALPLLMWLKGEAGQRIVVWLARLCEHRGGVLVFILPLVLIQLGLWPYFPDEHNWGDFFLHLVFFLAGYLFYADERFLRAARRDRWLVLGVAVASFLGLTATVGLGEDSWLSDPSVPWFHVLWALTPMDAWCWSLFMLFVGMRLLDFGNRWPQYGQEAGVPFYVLHYPVVLIIAFYVVQWQAGVTVKMLAVTLGSFVVTVGIYELLIWRVARLRALFGMKPRPTAPAALPTEAPRVLPSGETVEVSRPGASYVEDRKRGLGCPRAAPARHSCRDHFNCQGWLLRAMSAASYRVDVLPPLLIVRLALALIGIRLRLGVKSFLVTPVAVGLCFLVGHRARKLPLERGALWRGHHVRTRWRCRWWMSSLAGLGSGPAWRGNSPRRTSR